MSSHHFVREGQEPALLVLDPVDFGLAESLLEWAPLVLTSEQAVREVLSWGIKIDVVLARPSNAERLIVELADQAPIRIVSADDNVLSTALMFLTGSGQSAVSILCSRFEPPVRAIAERFTPQIQITVRENNIKWSRIKVGQFKKWFEKRSKIYLFDESLVSQVAHYTTASEGYEMAEDQWVNIVSGEPFWIGEST